MTSTVTSRASRKNGRRTELSPAERESADAARAARIAALHEQIGEQVEALVADPAWRAMLDTAAKFHADSLNNQLSRGWRRRQRSGQGLPSELAARRRCCFHPYDPARFS